MTQRNHGNSSAPPVDAVIFDLDGTLVHHGHALLTGFLAERGYTRTLERVDLAVETHLDWLYTQTKLNNGVWTHEAYVEFNARILRTLAVPDPDGTLAKESTDYFNSQPVPPLFDDVLPMLDHLAPTPVCLGIITQRGREGTEKFLHAHQLWNRFDVVIAGNDGHGRKPGAGPFRAALAGLACNAERAIFIGDRIDDDCEGAVAAGLEAFLIDRKRLYVDAVRSARFDRLDSLLDLMPYIQLSSDGTQMEHNA